MQIRAFRADAVVIATGGNGLIYGKSTMSRHLHRRGGLALLPGRRQVRQPGDDAGPPDRHPRRGQVPADLRIRPRRGRPRLGAAQAARHRARPTTSPRPSATTSSKSSIPSTATSSRATSPPARSSRSARRAIGVGGGNMVYLDLRRHHAKQIGREAVLKKLEGILEIYEKFVGTDPLDEPMKIFPAVHYTMGGLWTGFTKDEKTGGLKFGDPNNMMTNIPGLYAMGEVQLRLSRRQPPRGQLAALAASSTACSAARASRTTSPTPPRSRPPMCPQATYDAIVKQETDRQNWLIKQHRQREPLPALAGDGQVDDRQLHGRPPQREARGDARRSCQEWKERYQKVKLSDTRHVDQPEPLVHPRAARHDHPGRGDPAGRPAAQRVARAHYKPAFPERDDANFLKTTIATYDATNNAAVITYGPVDTSLIPPRARTYGKKDAKASDAGGDDGAGGCCTTARAGREHLTLTCR